MLNQVQGYLAIPPQTPSNRESVAERVNLLRLKQGKLFNALILSHYFAAQHCAMYYFSTFFYGWIYDRLKISHSDEQHHHTTYQKARYVNRASVCNPIGNNGLPNTATPQ